MSLIRCRFKGVAEFQHVIFENTASFYRADFHERALIRARFRGRTNFNESVFRRAAQFSGSRQVFLRGAASVKVGASAAFAGHAIPSNKGSGTDGSDALRSSDRFRTRLEDAVRRVKDVTVRVADRCSRGLAMIHQSKTTEDRDSIINRVFDDDVDFERVEFDAPSMVSFTLVDLSRALVLGTNFRGVRFEGVNWWQPALGRSGIREELQIARSPDPSYREPYLPILEATYRNIRVALEESRSFSQAADFYVGEMEAQRARMPFWYRHLFSVASWYRLLSMYGTDFQRALYVLGVFWSLHIAATVLIQWINIVEAPRQLLDAALHSLRLLVFQVEVADGGKLGLAQRWADTLFRIIATVQVALVIFAVRARIKRQ